jgi:hypothetical protein
MGLISECCIFQEQAGVNTASCFKISCKNSQQILIWDNTLLIIFMDAEHHSLPLIG